MIYGPVSLSALSSKLSAPSIILSGLVLAAGRSTRMGRDKALLEVDGVPLWQRQREVLAAAGADEILLSARPDQAWSKSVRGFSGVVQDALPGCGPIVGITAGLERATHPWLAVLAIDLPAIVPRWFAELGRMASTGVGAVGRNGDFFEPLAAIYPREMRWLAWEALARNEYSLQRLIAAGIAQGLMRVRDVSENEASGFMNWNSAQAGQS